MNDERDNAGVRDGVHDGVHPGRKESIDAAFDLANDLLAYAQGRAKEQHPGWCELALRQATFEATCIHLGILDGEAVLNCVARAGLARSLRSGMHAGREMMLEKHAADGCPGCEGSRDLRALTEAN